MAGFLCTRHIFERYGAEIRAVAAEAGLDLEFTLLPDDPAARLPAGALTGIDFSFFSGDVVPDFGRSYFAATQGAPNIKWMHTMNAGLDNPVFGRFLDRGVKVTTSSGSTAVPIAQTAIGGLLMLSRPFLAWGESQRRRAWEPRNGAPPADLGTQTLVVFGLGAIGKEIARLGRALGLHVVGVRRSPLAAGDPVDEMVTPAALLDVLPRADWLALACPLTEETRGVVSAAAIAAMPRGARILNVARGEVVDQEAMIAALREGRLGGAYLDVTTPEPLPPDSPLWDLPNVIISPHNSAVAEGNERRQVDMFLANLRRWGRGEPMINAAN